MFAWYKPDSHFWIYHAGHKSAEDAGKVLCLSFCNRCGWHSTKVVRDTLSYHPLSHQLSTQWKSCSTASNTWASLEVTFSFSDLIFFDRKKNTCAPPGQNVKRLKKPPPNDQKLFSTSRYEAAVWRVIQLPSSRFWTLLPTNLPLSGELPLEKGGTVIYGLNQDFPIHFQAKPFLDAF